MSHLCSLLLNSAQTESYTLIFSPVLASELLILKSETCRVGRWRRVCSEERREDRGRSVDVTASVIVDTEPVLVTCFGKVLPKSFLCPSLAVLLAFRSVVASSEAFMPPFDLLPHGAFALSPPTLTGEAYLTQFTPQRLRTVNLLFMLMCSLPWC